MSKARAEKSGPTPIRDPRRPQPDVPTEHRMHNPVELELLVRHLGKAKAIELVRLSRIPSAPGIAQAAVEALAAATEGFPGLYGEPSEARHALEDLRERFPS